MIGELRLSYFPCHIESSRDQPVVGDSWNSWSARREPLSNTESLATVYGMQRVLC